MLEPVKVLRGRDLSRPALAVQRLVAATDHGPLRRLWQLAYELVARAAARYVTAGLRGAAAYVRGSMAHGDAAHGVSDVDVVIVLGGDPQEPGAERVRAWKRWRRARRLPAVDELVKVAIYERAELEAAASAPALTYGLSSPGRPKEALFTREPYLEDELWLRARPGVYGPTADWRRLHGRGGLPAGRRGRQDERIAAWLELQFWWRHAIAACADPSGPRTGYLVVKLVSEPLRILLWLEQGERIDGRRALLERGLEVAPEERVAIEAAIDCLGSGPPRSASLELFLPAFARLSARIARSIEAALAPAGALEVSLAGAGEPEPLPLADWPAIVHPPVPFERFEPVPGSIGDPAAVAAAVRAQPATGAYRALREDDLLLFPLRELWTRTVLRTLACPVTDPVSFALLDGRRSASFPSARGWSAEDVAERAVAEHAPRLERPVTTPLEGAVLALTAARAAGLAESLAAGSPVLALTPLAAAEVLGTGAAQEVARALAEGGPPGEAAAHEALAAARRLEPYRSAADANRSASKILRR